MSAKGFTGLLTVALAAAALAMLFFVVGARASATGTNYFRIVNPGGSACSPGACQMDQISVEHMDRYVGVGYPATFSSHVLVWWFDTGTQRWGDNYPFSYNGWISNLNNGNPIAYQARRTCANGTHRYSQTKSLSNTVAYAYRWLGVFTVPGC